MFTSLNDILPNLFFRWQDEKEYEDINDYGEVIDKHLKANHPNIRFLLMNKVPFGFVFTYLDSPSHYRVTCNSRQMSWHQITPTKASKIAALNAAQKEYDDTCDKVDSLRGRPCVALDMAYAVEAQQKALNKLNAAIVATKA